MKQLAKPLFGAAAATALAVASASPAMARDNNGIDGGDILAGVLIAGVAAAVIASIDNDDDDYRGGDYRYGNNGYGNTGYGYNRGLTARAAVNQCSAAAQREASRYGRARINQITDVDARRDGYRVEGRLVVDENNYGRRGAYGYNARYSRNRHDYDQGRFSCETRGNRIADVDIDGI